MSIESAERPQYTLVPETLNAFRVVGACTPSILAQKLAMLADREREVHTAIVLIDGLRCASTLIASFAAGLPLAVVMEKGRPENGTSIERARELAQARGLQLRLGGELHGAPVPGGTIGNSPFDVFSADLRGCLLHFQSSNFGRLFTLGHQYAASLRTPPDTFIVGFANVRATVAAISRRRYDRVLVGCAGFFGCPAAEDLVVGGMVLSGLGVPIDDIDDDCFAMLSCFLSSPIATLERRWTARVLTRLSHFNDVTDFTGASRFSDAQRALMSAAVVVVQCHLGVPLLALSGSPSGATNGE